MAKQITREEWLRLIEESAPTPEELLAIEYESYAEMLRRGEPGVFQP